MKKLFFTLALALSIMTINAQDVGHFWVGGNLGFVSSKTKDTDGSQTSYKVLPEFGYVLNENIGVGLQVGYTHTEGNQDIFSSATYVPYSIDYNAYTIAPFVRYTFLKGSIGGLYVDGGVSYTSGKDKTNDLKSNILEIGFRPGIAISVSDNVSITGKFGFLGYQNRKDDEPEYVFDNDLNPIASKYSITTNSFGLNLDMSQFLVGVNIAF